MGYIYIFTACVCIFIFCIERERDNRYIYILFEENPQQTNTFHSECGLLFSALTEQEMLCEKHPKTNEKEPTALQD